MSRCLVAIRHAKPIIDFMLEDELLPLSMEGCEIQRRATQQLLLENIKPDYIYASPLLRAQQTAEIISELSQIKHHTEEALGYNFNTNHLLHLIRSIENNRIIFFIGHEPTLAQFVNALVGKAILPSGLSKSAAAVVNFENEVDFEKGAFVQYYLANS